MSVVRRCLGRVQKQLITDCTARLSHQAGMLGNHLLPGSSILDVGCGTGYLPKYLEEMYGVKSNGLDVADFNETGIAFRVFDGVRIPLPDQSFDHVMLSFTLHHAHDPMTLIQECRRVARRSVLVFEDMPDNRYGRTSSSSTSNCSGCTTSSGRCTTPTTAARWSGSATTPSTSSKCRCRPNGSPGRAVGSIGYRASYSSTNFPSRRAATLTRTGVDASRHLRLRDSGAFDDAAAPDDRNVFWHRVEFEETDIRQEVDVDGEEAANQCGVSTLVGHSVTVSCSDPPRIAFRRTEYKKSSSTSFNS